ncbi:MAG: hypothetical protein IANPNBLG_00321 [Bryobacteraceae bacterium]|nr:hypothetical protein [Bryobacteraceae bacterium]
MKRRLFLGTAVTGPLFARLLEQGERDRAVSYLHVTRKMFLDSVADVSPAQWEWKPAPDVWSIAQVAEHIALSENALFGKVRKTVSEPPAGPAQLAETRGKDDAIRKAAVDRGRKFQAPENLRPTSRWKSKAELVSHFKDSRDRTIEYVRTTTDDLRSHAAPHRAFGELDAYQWILYISGHSERHILQLNEVKTKPGYPRA